MTRANKELGSLGEQYSAQFLRKNGFQIIGINSTSRWGEIDIIAEKNNVIHFVEVKTRKTEIQGKPVEAVTYQKLKKLIRTVEFYILSHNLEKRKFQIDVIGLVLKQNNSIVEMKYYPNVAVDLFL